jgi:Domain of unknown function (DUF4388)
VFRLTGRGGEGNNDPEDSLRARNAATASSAVLRQLMREFEKRSQPRADKPSGVNERVSVPTDAGSRAPHPAGGFRATLENVGLWDLVQLSCGGRARGAACIRSGLRIGHLYFADGQIVHATIGDLDGERAALDILSWQDGTWHSCDMPWPARPSITTTWQGLLLRAAQEEDEARDGRPIRPPATSSSYRPADFEHAVRVDPHGTVVAGHGRTEELAALAAYVCRVGDLIGSLLGVDKLVAVDGSLADGSSCLILRRQSGDVLALRPREGVDLRRLRTQLQL